VEQQRFQLQYGVFFYQAELPILNPNPGSQSIRPTRWSRILHAPQNNVPVNQRLARASMHPHDSVEADEPEMLNLLDRVSAVALNALNTLNENQSSAQTLSSEPDWNIIPAAVEKPIPCIKCWYDKKMYWLTCSGVRIVRSWQSVVRGR
jgi:hypothetical protein